MNRGAIIAVLVGVMAAAASLARAQQARPLETAAELARAGHHMDAAVLLQRIVEGEVMVPAADLRSARVRLAVELHGLGLRQSALAIVAEHVEGSRGTVELRALVPLLAALASEMPSASSARDYAGRVEEADLVVAVGSDANVLARMRWLRGRHQYLEGSLPEAIATLEAIAATTPYYVASRMLSAGAHVRRREPGDAVRLLRAVVDHLGLRPSTPRRRAARELAMLNLGRLYYERGTRLHDASSIAVAAALFSTVPRTSRHHDAAQLGLAWAAFVAGALDRSAAVLDALPRDSREREGEGAFLRLLVDVDRCRADALRTGVAARLARTTRTRTALEDFFARTPETLDLVAVIQSLARPTPGVDPEIRGVLRAVVGDDRFRAQLAVLDMLGSEERALQAMPAGFRNASIGARVLEDITLAKALTFENVGDMVRMFTRHWIEERDDETRQLADAASACRGP